MDEIAQNKNRVPYRQAIFAAIQDLRLPIVSEYEIFLLARNTIAKRGYQDLQIRRTPPNFDEISNRNLIRGLVKKKTLFPDSDFSSSIYRLVQSGGTGTAEDVCCLADPFCYVSHLSAMQRYGITTRSPIELILTTPDGNSWSHLRDKKILSDLGPSFLGRRRPILRRPGIGKTVRRRPVRVHVTKYPGVSISIRGTWARVSSIGQTFADSVDEPSLCGGMSHVIDVWKEHARPHIEPIISAIEDHSSQIAKMRAGYLLEERLNVNDPRIDAWKRFAQRGSSRRLDPEAPYAPTYSEAWMISINV